MIKSTVIWTLARVKLPRSREQFLVSDGTDVGVARYFPIRREWRWPNAQSKRFDITMWAPLPLPQLFTESDRG